MPRGTKAGALWWAVQARDEGLRSTLKQSAKALRDYDRSVKDARRSMRRAGAQFRAFRSSVLSVRGAVGALAGAAGIGLMVKRFAEAADVMTLAQSRLKLVTEGTDELRQAQANLFAIAQQTGSAYEDTVTLYSRLARATEDLGVSQRKMLIFTRAVNQSLIVSGTTAQEARAGMIQLSQALASNRLGGDEYRSVSEQLTRFTRALADGLGVSIGKLRELSHAGKLTAETVLNATIGQAPKIAQEFAQVERTVQRALTELRNQYLQFVAAVNQGSGATKELIAAIDQLKKTLADPKIQKQAVEAATLLANSFRLLAENIKPVTLLFGGIFLLSLAAVTQRSLETLKVVERLSKGFHLLRNELLLLRGSLVFGPPGIAVGVAASLILALDQYAKSAEEARSRAKEFTGTFKQFKEIIDNTARSTTSAENKLKDYRNTVKLLSLKIDEVRSAARAERSGSNLEAQYDRLDDQFSALSRGLQDEISLLEAVAVKAAKAVASPPVTSSFLRDYTVSLEQGLALARQELDLARAIGAERLKLTAQFKVANDLVAKHVQFSRQLEDAQKKLNAARGGERESAQAAVNAAQAQLDAFQKTVAASGMLTAIYRERLTIQQQAAEQEAESQALRQAAVDHQQFVDSVIDATRQLQQEAAELTGEALEKTAEDVLGERAGDLKRQLRDALTLEDPAAAAGIEEQLGRLKNNEAAMLKIVQDRLDAEKLIRDIRAEQRVLDEVKRHSLESFDKEVELEFKKLENANKLAGLKGKELFEAQQLINLKAKEAALDEARIKAKNEGNEAEIKALEKMLGAVKKRLEDEKALTKEQQKRYGNLQRENDLIEEQKKTMEERKKLAQDISKALTDGLEQAVLGAKSLREAFREAALEVARIALRMAILVPLQKGLSALIGGLFGVKAPVPVPGAPSPIPPTLRPNSIRLAAGGGPVEAGRPYLVGEVGRELFVPPVGGEIIPNYKLRPALGGGGGVVVNFGDINIESTDGPGVRAAMAEAIPVIENRLSRLVSGQVQTDLSRPSPLRGIR